MNITDYFKIKYLIQKFGKEAFADEVYIRLINWIDSEILKCI